jgi:hypothetical protein
MPNHPRMSRPFSQWDTNSNFSIAAGCFIACGNSKSQYSTFLKGDNTK